MNIVAPLLKFLGLQRRSLENPNLSLNDPRAWEEAGLMNARTSAGVAVTSEAALGYAAVWRAVNLISRDLAKIPIHVFQRLPDGGRQRVTSGPAHMLLAVRPHPNTTPFQLKMTLQSHVLLYGNAYAWIGMTNQGVPSKLTIADPTRTEPVFDRQTGLLTYVTTMDSGERVVVPERQVLHFKGMGFDGLRGYSVLRMAAETIGSGLAARKFGAIYYKNNARPNVVLKHPGMLDDAAYNRLKASWAASHSGIENAHKPAILEDGLTLETLSMNADDAQLIESRQFEVREIANIFGVPPHKLGDPSRTSYASLEQEEQSYLNEALDGWMVNFEEEVSYKLIPDGQFCEFARNALVRADMSTRFTSYSVALQNGIMSRNEVRNRENLNPVDGGDVFLLPLNMAPSGGAPDADDDARAASLRLVHSTILRWATRTCKIVKRCKDVGESLDLAAVTLLDELTAVVNAVRKTLCLSWRAAERIADDIMEMVRAEYLNGAADDSLPATLADIHTDIIAEGRYGTTNDN